MKKQTRMVYRSFLFFFVIYIYLSFFFGIHILLFSRLYASSPMKKKKLENRLQKFSAVKKKLAASRRHSSRTSSKISLRKRHSPEETRTLRSSDSRDESSHLNRVVLPVKITTGQRRSRKAKRVTQAVAIHRLQRWFRSRLLFKRVNVQGCFRALVQARKFLEESLEAIRVTQAKRTLKMFFDYSCHVARMEDIRRRKSDSRMRRARDSIAYRGKVSVRALDEEEKEALETIQAGFLAKLSINEILRREAKQMRGAAIIIMKHWVSSPLYRYLRHLSLNRLTQRVLTQHETIERREIMRRYYKALIEMHQGCYNDKVAADSGCKTRHVSLHYSLLLFSTNNFLKDIMDDVRKPYGVGPYHPYSVEKVPDDFHTIRILERRFMFSKEERRLLQDEGILDVNEPPEESLCFFDPSFVFGSVLDYLRPGDFLDKLRSNHPSLRLGIRRTSSLVLDSDFQITEENGIQSTDKGAMLSLPSPWSLRRNCAAFHTLMCQLGYISPSEVDGTLRPAESNVRKWGAEPVDISKEGAQQLQQLYTDRLFVANPSYSKSFPFSSFAMNTPLVQDLLLSEYTHQTQGSKNSILLDGGDPISNSVLHPEVKESPRKDSRNSGKGKTDMGTNHGFGKYSMSTKPPKARLWRYFSSTRVLGDTWKTFLERANLSEGNPKGLRSTSRFAALDISGRGGRGSSFVDESGSTSPTAGRGSKSEFSFTESISLLELDRVSMTDSHSVEKEPIFPPVSNTRKYKHLTLLFSPPDDRDEKGLDYFLHQASKGTHEKSLGLAPGLGSPKMKKMLPNSRVISTECKATEKKEQESRGILRPLPCENKSKVLVDVSPIVGGNVAVQVKNLPVEVERLVIKENLTRQDLWRRFMLIFESIGKMRQLEIRRKEAVLQKFLHRDM